MAPGFERVATSTNAKASRRRGTIGTTVNVLASWGVTPYSIFDSESAAIGT